MKAARALLVAGCALALGACGSLPDLDRGRDAVKSGDYQAAEKDLQPLAERGYVEAQKDLARIHARTAKTPEELREAAYWYGTVIDKEPMVAVPLAKVLLALGDVESLQRAVDVLHAADARGDARALSTLIEVYTQYPQLDKGHATPALVERAARMDTPEAEAAIIKWYRLNAGEPRYAKALVDRCSKARDRVPECYVDLVRHYRINGDKKALKDLIASSLQGYKAGDITPQTMERLGWSLVADDVPGEAFPESAYQLLKLVADDSPQAQVRVARVLVEYPYVDPDGKPEELLLRAVKTGDPEAALGLGKLYLNGITVPVDPVKAVHYLEMASRALPAAHYYLGRVYKKGMLGKPDPVRAAQHYLIAARYGYENADVALAQLYSDNRGVRPNPVNAWVFANLAATNAVPDAQELLNQLRPSMSPKQVQDGQRLLQEEVAARRITLMAAGGDPAVVLPKPEQSP